jgi:hypothetical protein
MLFKFKKKKTTVDFFTSDPAVFHNAPITKYNKLLPNWLKTVDKNTPTSTIKQCNGFTDFVSNALTIPLWTEVRIDVSKEGLLDWTYECADKKTQIVDHPAYQRGTYLPPTKYLHQKIVSPWVAVASRPLKMNWSAATWSFDNPEDFIALPAIIDFHYSHGTNINAVVLKTDKNRSVNLSVGQPLINIMPMTEDDVEFKCHLVDQKEVENITGHIGFFQYFNNGINKAKKNPLRCPFSRETDKRI